MIFYEGDTELDMHGPFGMGKEEYTFDYWVDPSVCHKVKMEDSWSDGICCGYGDGFFKVYLNGGLVGEAPIGPWSEYEVDINCN